MSLNRRGLLKASLGLAGVALFDIALPGLARAADDAPVDVTAWLLVHPDSRVVLRIPQTELGQGVTTALAQIFMEELGLGWDLFETEFFDPQVNRESHNVFVHTSTLNSWSTELLFTPMRTAGAQIRHRLFAAAAKTLDSRADALRFEAREIIDEATGRRVALGEIAGDAAALPVPDPASLRLKKSDQWTLIGTPVPRRDGPDKVAGRATYGIDVMLPGMKFAAVQQSPVFGGRLHHVDPAPALGQRGVHAVVQIKGGPTGYTVPDTLWDTIDWGMDDAVAVVADNTWLAQRALDALSPQWDEGSHGAVDSAGIEEALYKALDAPGTVTRAQGAQESAAERTIEAEYHYPYMEHAPLEPMNCTALVTDEGVEVWAGSQFAEEAQRVAAYAAGVPIRKVRFHLMLTGGGFGRRLSNDFVSQAVQVARTLRGTPVKLIASRAENIRRGYYAPIGKARFKGGLDAAGRVTTWHSKVVFGRAPIQPYGLSRIPFAIPNIHCEYGSVETPPPFGWMRGVGHTQGAWMNHLFMAELAEAAGRSPLSMMEALLDADALPKDLPSREFEVTRVRRQKRLLEEAVARGGMPGAMGKRTGRGFAVVDMSYLPGDHSTCIAMTMEVALDDKHWPRVSRVVAVVDCGLVVNPKIVEAQVEGGILFGLSNALRAEITLKAGRVVQQNFDDYPLLRIHEAPRIEVHLMPASDQTPTGIGEGTVPVVMAALVMSIRAAGGPWVRRLPVAAAQG